MRKNRFFFIMMAAVYLLCLLASCAFIACEADHECCGHDCPVCEVIATCNSVLKLLGFAVAVLMTLCLVFRTNVFRDMFSPVLFLQKTPVSLKVLLLN